jgi:hypothetical protein
MFKILLIRYVMTVFVIGEFCSNRFTIPPTQNIHVLKICTFFLLLLSSMGRPERIENVFHFMSQNALFWIFLCSVTVKG